MESKVGVQFLTVPPGSDVVEKLQNLVARQGLQAAFVIRCVGEVNRATIRLANASPGFNPIKEVRYTAQITSLVGTLSQDGHLHISLVDNNGDIIGGHVHGPLIASGTVKAVVGECMDLCFERPFDPQTGFPELSVTEKPPLSQQSQQAGVLTGVPMVRAFALRLTPGADIFESLKSFAAKENLQAAFVLTCVGSVRNGPISLASQPQNDVIELKGRYEIVGLAGMLQANSINLYISLSDKVGDILHGDVLGNLLVFTTAEIIVGEYSACDVTQETSGKACNKKFLNWIDGLESSKIDDQKQ